MTIIGCILIGIIVAAVLSFSVLGLSLMFWTISRWTGHKLFPFDQYAVDVLLPLCTVVVSVATVIGIIAEVA